MPKRIVRNPKTGRKIKVGGPTYNKLKASGYKFSLKTRVAKKKSKIYKEKKTGYKFKRHGKRGPMTRASQKRAEELLIKYGFL